MQHDSWLVKRTFLGYEGFKKSYLNEDGTSYMRVHYASCRQTFLKGINPNVQLLFSVRLTYEKARYLCRSSLETAWEVSKIPYERLLKAYLEIIFR